MSTNLCVGPSSASPTSVFFFNFNDLSQLITILQKVRDRLKYRGNLAKMYPSWVDYTRLLILASNAVQYSLLEPLRVQTFQVDEVKRSVSTQGLYHQPYSCS